MNQITIIGKAGRDAKAGVTANGKQWANVSVATSEKIKDVWVPTWHNVVGWGKTAEKLSLVKKGDKIFASGKMQFREYEAKDGTKKQSAELLAWTIFVSAPENYTTPETQTDNEFDPQMEGDLPF